MFFNEQHAASLKDSAERILGIELSDQQTLQFCSYGNLLLEWNGKMNLTRITDPDEIIIKHFIDSLTLAKYIEGNTLADIGTGAGFPGLPLKILFPELEVVLVDSLAKRLSFLETVIDQLKLKGIKTVHARAEEFGRDPKYRERFDMGVARAVAKLPVLLEYVLPILKVKGKFIAAKGAKGEEEIAESKNALEILHGKIIGVDKLSLGQEAEHRTIIVIEKEKATPKAYPRKPGTPEKKPL